MANNTMTAKLNNVKNMFKVAKGLLLGSVKTGLSATKTSEFAFKFRERYREHLKENIKYYTEKLAEIESNKENDPQYWEEIEKKAKSQGPLSPLLRDHYEAEKRRAEDFAVLRQGYYNEIRELSNKLAQLDNNDFEAYLEVAKSKGVKIESEKERRLKSYFHDRVFEFGDKVIDVSKKRSERTYTEIMKEFEKAENSKYMVQAWNAEAIGIALVGSDFIRKFYPLNDQNRKTVLVALSKKLENVQLPQDFVNKSLDEQVNILKSLGLPSYRVDMLNILENQKSNKLTDGKIENNIKSPKDLPAPDSKVQEKKAGQPAVPSVTVEKSNKDEIHNQHKKINLYNSSIQEIENEISKLSNKYNSSIEEIENEISKLNDEYNYLKSNRERIGDLFASERENKILHQIEELNREKVANEIQLDKALSEIPSIKELENEIKKLNDEYNYLKSNRERAGGLFVSEEENKLSMKIKQLIDEMEVEIEKEKAFLDAENEKARSQEKTDEDKKGLKQIMGELKASAEKNQEQQQLADLYARPKEKTESPEENIAQAFKNEYPGVSEQKVENLIKDPKVMAAIDPALVLKNQEQQQLTKELAETEVVEPQVESPEEDLERVNENVSEESPQISQEQPQEEVDEEFVQQLLEQFPLLSEEDARAVSQNPEFLKEIEITPSDSKTESKRR